MGGNQEAWEHSRNNKRRDAGSIHKQGSTRGSHSPTAHLHFTQAQGLSIIPSTNKNINLPSCSGQSWEEHQESAPSTNPSINSRAVGFIDYWALRQLQHRPSPRRCGSWESPALGRWFGEFSLLFPKMRRVPFLPSQHWNHLKKWVCTRRKRDSRIEKGDVLSKPLGKNVKDHHKKKVGSPWDCRGCNQKTTNFS